MNDEGRTTKDEAPQLQASGQRSSTTEAPTHLVTLSPCHRVTPSPLHRVRRAGLQLIGRLYPRPRLSNVAPRSILLIRPDHLGDVLFLTPALHALRERLPDVRITLLVGSWSQAVVANNPDLDAVEICSYPGFERGGDRGGFSAVATSRAGKRGLGIAEIIALMRGNPPLRLAPYRLLFSMAGRLRSGGYDTAVVLRFDHWWGAWLAAAAGIPRRVGYAWPETQPFLTEALPYLADRHEVEQNGALLAALAPVVGAGFSASMGSLPSPHDCRTRQTGVNHRKPAPTPLGPTRFTIAPADRDWAPAWLIAHGADLARPLVAIHPGAGAAVKQWLPTAWAEVANRLASERGAQIVLTGGAGERGLVEAVAADLSQSALDAAGQTTLGQLAALYQRCALVLGSDSGPLHLAVAVAAPTVHLYGPVDVAKFGPWGDPTQHAVLATPWPCAPCNRLDWPAETLAAHACMAAITVEDVVRVAYRVVRVPRSHCE